MPKQTTSRKPTQASRSRATSAKKPAIVEPTHDAIAARAFELFLSRGASDGSDLSDWLRAENELKARAC